MTTPPHDYEAIAKEIVLQIVKENGDQPFISEGYECHHSLAALIAAALQSEYERGRASVLERLPSEDKYTEFLSEIGLTKEKGYSTIHFMDFWDIYFGLHGRLTATPSEPAKLEPTPLSDKEPI